MVKGDVRFGCFSSWRIIIKIMGYSDPVVVNTWEFVQANLYAKFQLRMAFKKKDPELISVPLGLG